MNKLAFLKAQLSFVLTLICIVGAFALRFAGHDIDMVSLLPMLLGIYVGAITVQRTSSVIAASKDPNCSTVEVIKHTDPSANG